MLSTNKIIKPQTSELIFDITFNNTNNYNKKIDIEKELYNRLEKKYKLDHDTSKLFINQEQYLMRNRSDNLTDYLFGKEHTVEEALQLLYTYEKKISLFMKTQEHFNNITFSEISDIGYICIALLNKIRYREKLLLKAEKKELNLEKSNSLKNN